MVGARFSAPVQTDPGAHPAYYTMSTGSLGVKQSGRGVDHPPPFSAEVKERVELPLLFLWAFMAYSRANFTFTFTIPNTGKQCCPINSDFQCLNLYQNHHHHHHHHCYFIEFH